MKNLPERPRVVLTGAGGGLGRAFVQQLARRKPRMLLIDNNGVRAEESAAIVIAEGGEAIVHVADVTRPGVFAEAATTMDQRFGGTDLLINNAGVAVGGEIGQVPLTDWEWLLRINLYAAIDSCHVFIPAMRARKSGAILNVASCAGLVAMPRMGPYNVSKAGLVALSESLDAEAHSDGVSVSALCPTFFKSHLLEGARFSDPKSRKIAEFFFKRTFADADAVAAAGLRGLERGTVVIIPQIDGRLLWHLKRFFPWLVRAFARRPH